MILAFSGYFDNETIYESNEIDLYYKKYGNSVAPATNVVSGDWTDLCLAGKGSDPITSLFIDLRIPKINNISGNVIAEEPLLEYLVKFIFVDKYNNIKILNFDDRVYLVNGQRNCFKFDSTIFKFENVNKSNLIRLTIEGGL